MAQIIDIGFLHYLIDQKRLRQRITDDPAEVRRLEIEIKEAQKRLCDFTA